MSTNADQVLQASSCSPRAATTAAEVIDKQIAKYEREIHRLKRMRRLLVKTTSVKPKATSLRPTTEIVREEIEKRIYDFILSTGPQTPATIADALSVHAITVGRAVAASNRLTKAGEKVIIG